MDGWPCSNQDISSGTFTVDLSQKQCHGNYLDKKNNAKQLSGSTFFNRSQFSLSPRPFNVSCNLVLKWLTFRQDIFCRMILDQIWYIIIIKTAALWLTSEPRFRDSRLIRWIHPDKIYKKLTWKDLTKDWTKITCLAVTHLTISLECFLCLCEAEIESYSCMGGSVRSIYFI